MSNIFKITSCQSQIGRLEDYVSDISKEFNVDSNKYPDILISLTEAVNNAIIHGNSNDVSKCVDIICKCKEQFLTFTISDQGEGFNPEQLSNPLDETNIALEGGRGVLIMKSLCDEVQYKNDGRTVEMTFNLKECD